MLDKLNTSANKALISGVLLPLSQVVDGVIKYGWPDFYAGFWTPNGAAIWTLFGALSALLVYLVPNKEPTV